MAVNNHPQKHSNPFTDHGLHNDSLSAQNVSGKEKNDVVKCLPRGTREYEFQGMNHAEKILQRESTTGCEYVLFSHFPPHLEDEISKLELPKRYSYYQSLGLLFYKMAHEPHEGAAIELHDLLVSKLAAMGILQGLWRIGSAEVQGSDRKKCPDISYLPKILPTARSTKWPTLTIEVGYSESRLQRERDARWWLEDAPGEVQTVLTIDVERARKEITIQRWGTFQSYPTRNHPSGLRPEVVQTVSMSRDATQATTTVNNGPLIVPFQQLFLRQPVHPESDITFTTIEMQGLAENVWELQGL